MKRGIVVIALVALPVFADDVYLRGGGQITGEIVERGDDSVTVDIGGGTLTVRRSSIVRIEESVSPLQEYRARAARVPAGDAEAWRELAQWATRQVLSSQASEAYSQVVAILPNDEEANRALDRVRLNGQWVTVEESYRARGYVKFEHHWMTPAERQTILEDRRARETANRRAVDAEVKAIEAEQKAAKEQEEAEREAFRRGNLPQLGDPVVWGWGAGPTHWPQHPQQQPRNPAESAASGW